MENKIKTRTFFLPGAGGDAQFWQPLADEILHSENLFFSWPGLGNEDHDECVQSIDALVDMVAEQIEGPINLVAQSMGGIVAVRLALRYPKWVKRMVLVATSAGVDMTKFGASDWRPEYRAAYPNAAQWIEEVSVDLTEDLKCLDIPILLIWGDCDKISPVSVGEHLEQILPNAVLHVVKGGDHDLGLSYAQSIAPYVQNHLDAS